MLTRYIPIVRTDIATGDLEVDMWADLCQALGCMQNGKEPAQVDALVQQAMAEGRLASVWAGAGMVKITIEQIRPCDNLSTSGDEKQELSS